MDDRHSEPQLRRDVARMVDGEAEPTSPSKKQSFSAAWQDLASGVKRHQLWLMLGLQDIKQRYRRSVLGPIWITIATGVMALALGLLYSVLFDIPIAEFLPHVTVGLIVWTFLSGCIIEGSRIFTDNEGLIQQLPAPLSVHVYRLVWRQLLLLGHNMIIWVILVAIFPRHLGWQVLLAVPALALFVLNGVWVATLFGILATRFRDITPLLESLVQLCFYLTPIVWMTDTLEENAATAGRAKLAELNPFFHYLEVIRTPLIGGHVEAYHWYVVIGFTVGGLLLALFALKKWRFRVSYWV
ncbi:galactan export ABC transporter permease subunit Wzm/RfbD [Corynebacterium otitidis]|uniref:O-antigen export system permease protein n=1 Tax=Corynebacterium otitidis ATCC 51513 TaxID=883169 RepID=I7LCK8_9CORY|nr:hypothetical protein HMPREF9719_01685 [Corynebacterium otitidis ATCC 51513]CCI84044.1 O-antigen export system permease protein [Corynebacterium otitidis ATCC 51513]